MIGLRGTPNAGSLMDFGVTYRKLDLTPSGSIDWEALASAIRPGLWFGRVEQRRAQVVGWGVFGESSSCCCGMLQIGSLGHKCPPLCNLMQIPRWRRSSAPAATPCARP